MQLPHRRHHATSVNIQTIIISSSIIISTNTNTITNRSNDPIHLHTRQASDPNGKWPIDSMTNWPNYLIIQWPVTQSCTDPVTQWPSSHTRLMFAVSLPTSPRDFCPQSYTHTQRTHCSEALSNGAGMVLKCVSSQCGCHTLGPVIIWVSACLHTGKPCHYITNCQSQLSHRLHPSRVSKSNTDTSLHGWG